MAKKKTPYFDDFIKMAEVSCRAAAFLKGALTDFQPDQLAQQCIDMHHMENEEDMMKHDMMARISKEFITPIDREDIIEMANELDDVTDKIEDILIRIRMYNVREIREDAFGYLDIIERSCGKMLEAMKEFPNFRKSATLTDAIIAVNTIEEEGDGLYIKAVHKLFRNEKDPIAIVAWSNIFDLMEDCCDACEDVANTMEVVRMKNS